MRSVLIVIALATVTGCGMPSAARPMGLLFSYTTEPLTEDACVTPSSIVLHDRSDVRQFAVPRVSGLKVQWHTNALGDIARECGMRELHYADLEVLTILEVFGGLWRQEIVHLYGD